MNPSFNSRLVSLRYLYKLVHKSKVEYIIQNSLAKVILKGEKTLKKL